MIVTVAFLAFLAITALGLALVWSARRARHEVRGVNPGGTPLSRDLAEHAGGSRHIRTNPSWRDLAESSGGGRSWVSRPPPSAGDGMAQAQDRSADALDRLSRAMNVPPGSAPAAAKPEASTSP